jgi:hypothetical protein
MSAYLFNAIPIQKGSKARTCDTDHIANCCSSFFGPLVKCNFRREDMPSVISYFKTLMKCTTRVICISLRNYVIQKDNIQLLDDIIA